MIARVLAAVVVTWLLGLAAVDAALSFLLERDSYGTGSSDPRPGYLVLYGLVLGGCITGSIIAWRWLLPGARGWALPAIAFFLVVGAVVLGATGL